MPRQASTPAAPDLTSAHSLKGLKTLELMGCDTNGWDLPPFKWVKQIIHVQVKVPCPTCHGNGQVADEEARAAGQRFARKQCPTCPPRRGDYAGTGYVEKMEPREVEVSVPDWPKGTRWDSRFCAGNGQCELCAKRIYSPFSWLPVLGKNARGEWVAMWVGRDCGCKLLKVAGLGITAEVAHGQAIANREAMRVWRELPKPPKPPKPAKPVLADVPPKAEVEAAARASLPLWMLHWNVTQAIAEIGFCLDVEDPVPGSMHTYRPTYDLRVSARHGAVLKTMDVSKERNGFHPYREVWRDTACFDVRTAAAAAIAAIRKDRKL